MQSNHFERGIPSYSFHYSHHGAHQRTDSEGNILVVNRLLSHAVKTVGRMETLDSFRGPMRLFAVHWICKPTQTPTLCKHNNKIPFKMQRDPPYVLPPGHLPTECSTSPAWPLEPSIWRGTPRPTAGTCKPATIKDLAASSYDNIH